MMLKNIYFTGIFLFISCGTFDEKPPNPPEGLNGYFSMKDSAPFVRIKWNEILDDNSIEIYRIYRSISGVTDSRDSFDVSASKQFYIDRDIEWYETYDYQIKSKDHGENLSEFSSILTIHCYKASGKWTVDNDSTFICVDSSNYSILEGFDIYSTKLDTVLRKAFSPCFFDTNSWRAEGWMTKSKIYKDTSINTYTEIISDTLDTVIANIDTTIITFQAIMIQDTSVEDIIINELPDDYEINLSDPSSGIITFLSDINETISLSHSIENCNGENLFP